MSLWFRNLRISILNWFAAGRMTIEKEKKPMAYTLTGNPNAILNTSGTYQPFSPNPAGMQTQNTMSIKITPANGGTIIQVNNQEYSVGELYIIPDGVDFDRELGKIITVSKLKS